jgi:hypothetical protein
VCAGALGIADSQKNLEKNGEFAVFFEADQQLYKHELNKTEYGVDK